MKVTFIKINFIHPSPSDCLLIQSQDHYTVSVQSALICNKEQIKFLVYLTHHQSQILLFKKEGHKGIILHLCYSKNKKRLGYTLWIESNGQYVTCRKFISQLLSLFCTDPH